MGKSIIQLPSGLTVGFVALGYRAGVTGSVRQQVHDGDTITVRTDGNFGVRFLGVDAPEISFMLPGKKTFTSMSNADWETYLSDPFAPGNVAFDPPLNPGLLNHLKASTGPGTALNQYNHATAAEDALEAEVSGDVQILNQSEDDFRFFLAFAHEIMDMYGRLLCFINRNQPDANVPCARPPSYNERLLALGLVSPYFIWPNVNPFRTKKSLKDAIIPKNKAKDIADADATLKQARDSIRVAKQQQTGIFDAAQPLRLQPFEIRFLARRNPPNRWVIDLSKNDDTLIDPQEYYTVELEDRLFIPDEFVPLFVDIGWKK